MFVIGVFSVFSSWLWSPVFTVFNNIKNYLNGYLPSGYDGLLVNIIIGSFTMPVLLPLGVFCALFVFPPLLRFLVFLGRPTKLDNFSIDGKSKLAIFGASVLAGRHVAKDFTKGWIKEDK